MVLNAPDSIPLFPTATSTNSTLAGALQQVRATYARVLPLARSMSGRLGRRTSVFHPRTCLLSVDDAEMHTFGEFEDGLLGLF
jgi:hypothetical protein